MRHMFISLTNSIYIISSKCIKFQGTQIASLSDTEFLFYGLCYLWSIR